MNGAPRSLLLPDEPLEELARQGVAVDLGMSVEEVERLAALSYAINLADARRRGTPLDSNYVPYLELPSARRAAVRQGIVRLIQAMVVLGWIERP